MVTEIYLRHAATDQDIAAAVQEALEKVGFVVRDDRGSESFRALAREAVDVGGALLLLWSEAMSDPDWVDADMKLIVAAWSHDRLLLARIDGAALPVGLRDQPCHELRSDQLDRDIGNLTLSILAQRRREQKAERREPAGPSSRKHWAGLKRALREKHTPSVDKSVSDLRDGQMASLRPTLIAAVGVVAIFIVAAGVVTLWPPPEAPRGAEGWTKESKGREEPAAIEPELPPQRLPEAIALSPLAWPVAAATAAQREPPDCPKARAALEEALRQREAESNRLEAEVNRLKEERRKTEERLKTLTWLLWTGGAGGAIAIISIGAYYPVRVGRQAPRPEKRVEPDAFIGVTSTLAAVGESFPTPQLPIFVSYSRKDEPVVQSIVQELRGSGYAVWIDFASQQGVQRFASSIVAAIRGCRVFALVGSRNAFASDHVIREVYVAGDFKKPFLVFEIDMVDFPDDVLYFISGFPRVSMTDIATGKVQAAVSRLLAAV